MTDHAHDPGPPDTHDAGLDGAGRAQVRAEDRGPDSHGADDADEAPTAAAMERSGPLVGEVVVRDPAKVTAAQPRLSRGIALARERYVALSANPAVVTAVTVGAGLAAGLLRQALASGSRGQTARGRTLTVSGLFIHRVDVVHHHVVHQHVVHHQAGRPVLPPGGPSPR